MKYALITDIHGNLEALQAVLAWMDRAHPDATPICAGDIVGYGPDPGACIELLCERQVACVRGNHEEMVLGLRDFSRCISSGILAVRWTRRQLTAEQLGFLAQLPIRRCISEELHMCHGDLLSADTYISDALAAEAALAQMQALAPGARWLACGHTHHPALYVEGQHGFNAGLTGAHLLDPARRHVINPGAVGQSRDGEPRARLAILDLAQHRVSFEDLAYDHITTERKMRQAGLRGGVVLLPPSGLQRRVERARTRWERYWGDRENRRLGHGHPDGH